MKIVIIESPLAGAFERNRRYALWCAYHCRTRGEASYASHLYYTQFLDDRSAEDRAFGIAAGTALSKFGSLIAFYIDRGWSTGMADQRDRILQGDLNMPYEHRQLPLEMMQAFQEDRLPNATPGF